MNIYLNGDKCNCCGCGACVNICPRDAVSMEKDAYGFAYPVVDPTRCVECNLCVTACQKVNDNQSGMPLKAFAASHRDKAVLKKSTSGGVFSAVAEHILNNGGAVCGCIFDEHLHAIHICTEKQDDFFKIRKSKYVQSDVGQIYREIKARLKTGQPVLFSGTPCQVAALYAVVGREHNNLLTMDLICHGVPSQAMFDQFIHYLEKQYKTEIVDFDFRSKKYGWARFTMEFTNASGRRINLGKAREFYIPAFTGGNIIRSSCLSCKYACANRVGDITIGDLWGFEKFRLEHANAQGLSVFTINTDAAKRYLPILKETLICEEIDYTTAVAHNTCLHNPTPAGEKRDVYMQALKDGRVEDIALAYKKSNKKKIAREKVKFVVPTTLFHLIRKIKAK